MTLMLFNKALERFQAYFKENENAEAFVALLEADGNPKVTISAEYLLSEVLI
jgi:hypothetical protein